MESTIRQTTGIKHELDVALTKEDLTPYLDTAYRQAQKTVALKGFRKGKVPIQMIRKMYGAALEQEAHDDAIQKEFARCAEQQEIRPVGQPVITKLDRTEDGGISFTIAYEVMPQFELGEYKAIPAQRIYHVVGQEEIEDGLRRIQEGQATLEDAESISDENHTAMLDFVRLDNGEPQTEGAMNDVPVYMRRDDVNKELKASLLNTKVGDTFQVDLPTGEDEAVNTYDVTVKKISRVVMPELDDVLAAKLLGEGSTAEDLTDYVRQGIGSDFDQRYSGMFRDQLINTLVDRHEFDVPEILVQEVLRSFIEDMKKGKNKQLPEGFDQQKFAEENHELAQRTAKWALIRDKIIEAEQIQPDDADYEGLADIESQRLGVSYDALLNYIKTSDNFRDRIVAEKSLQLLEDYAITTEVEDRELIAIQQQAAAAAAAAGEPATEEAPSEEEAEPK